MEIPFTDQCSIAYASSALAPVFGFELYILIARAYDTITLTNSIAFSALTLFALLDQPMVSLVHGGEEISTVVNSFSRIQVHLLEDERIECRQTSKASSSKTISTDREAGATSSDNEDSTSGLALRSLPRNRERTSWDEKLCAIVRDASVSYSGNADPLLKDLSFEIESGKITMVIGPVGCGKTTLLKLLIGEISKVTGSIVTAYVHAAYCSQSPWMTFGTIRQNILGPAVWNREWYDTVTHACALQVDLQDFANGDQTKVGTRGSRLSGGQQVRVVSVKR